MGQNTSTTDTFERILERGRRQLSTARDEYDGLEGTDAVPDRIVEAIGDLEQELDELDQTLEVDDENITLAEQTTQRVSILVDILFALRERQRTIVEGDLQRLDHQVSGLASLARQHDDDHDLDAEIDEVERHFSMLEKLVDNQRYKQVLTNDRVTPETVDTEIRDINAELNESISATPLTDTYIEITEELLDEIHSSLSELGEENDDRTAFSAELRNIKDQIAESKKARNNGEHKRACRIARQSLEDCLAQHYEIIRAHAEQRVTGALAETARESELVIDCDIDGCVSRGDSKTLLEHITDEISSQVDLSTSERLNQLLREHDGSVVRTANSTDFDVASILSRLEELYQEEQISEITVEFQQ